MANLRDVIMQAMIDRFCDNGCEESSIDALFEGMCVALHRNGLNERDLMLAVACVDRMAQIICGVAARGHDISAFGSMLKRMDTKSRAALEQEKEVRL